MGSNKIAPPIEIEGFQPANSEIFTKEGYKKLKDIKINEKIFGENGKEYSVLEVSELFLRDVYEIELSDKNIIRCSDNQLLTVWRKHATKCRTITSKVLFESKIYNQDEYKEWLYFIPIADPLIFKEKNIKIPPYVLGVLLGDGHLPNNGTPSITNSELDIIEKVQNLLPNFKLKISISEDRADPAYLIVNKIKNMKRMEKNQHRNPLTGALFEYGLMGKRSYEKFIPKEYLYNSFEIRLDVLRGLIDTDGEVRNNGYCFSTTSKQLSDDICFLVHSLGGITTFAERQTFFTYKGTKKPGLLSYRIYIRMPEKIHAFSSEKHTREYKKGLTSINRTIRNINYIGQEDCLKIKVSNPSGLYLSSNLIVTHDSYYNDSQISYMGNDKNKGFTNSQKGKPKQ